MDSQSDVTIRLPSLSDWILINVTYVWGFPDHTSNIRHRGQLVPSLVRVISIQPTHRIQSLAILMYSKHTYFCNLPGALEPCIGLKRKFQFVQYELCSNPAGTPVCHSLAHPRVWFPTRGNASSFWNLWCFPQQAFCHPRKVFALGLL